MNTVSSASMPVSSRKHGLLITIDGPAGAGKTTVSRMLADRLGYRYLDTGALYRAVAVAVQDAGLDPETAASPCLKIFLLGIQLEYRYMNSLEARVTVNGTDVTSRLRSPEMALLASSVSARPEVREFLLGQQQRMGRDGGMVCEGRDMGTVVFPDADIKFYLDASPDIRARRRYGELPPETRPDLSEIVRQILARDLADSTRAIAPLRKPEDARVIDSSELDAVTVVTRMESDIRSIFRIS